MAAWELSVGSAITLLLVKHTKRKNVSEGTGNVEGIAPR